MRRLVAAIAVAASLLVSGVANAELSPEATSAADAVRGARQIARLAILTKASKSEYNRAVKMLNKKVPGRSCDADDWLLTCSMEDGRNVSVEAVPADLAKDKAEELCKNPYAENPEEITFELKGNAKQGFLMLWCTAKADGQDVQAANRRIEAAKPNVTKPFFSNMSTEKKVDGVEMFFIMGEPYDPKNEFDDDEPVFTSVRNTTIHDDRGTFLAALEALEKWCRPTIDPMNVDPDRFKKLKADWLKKPATAANYRKASKEFKSIRIRPIEDAQAFSDYDWPAVCNNVNTYVMELKIFKHLPDADWSEYEAAAPAWVHPGVSGTFPYIDQVKFSSYRIRPFHFCSSAPSINQENWRLIRNSRRLQFTVKTANAEQTKDLYHYANLIHEARQRIAWNQPRDGDLVHLARVCREYEALISHVNEITTP